MSLITLPDELIYHCSFLVIAHNPLGPPSSLLTLALICRKFNAIVSSHAFKARIFRFMFDVGPVTRRLFHPRDSDLADELQCCCNVLSNIRRADVAETEDPMLDHTLISAYVLMLSNDGKNYAQLEHAGLDAYVNKFITTRFSEGRETNLGWPLDNYRNSMALWLMWMTLTKQKLATVAYLDFTRLILPYVVLPHRYASASAPPNHFNLPLDPQNPYHQQPCNTSVAPEIPYPIYPSGMTFEILYFNARMTISSPLTTIPAKLLFVAMKEMVPTRAPPHLPLAPGPGIVGETQQDYREVNQSPGARLCRVVTWNWVTGSPNRVDGDPCEIDDRWEESKVWDTEWWRRLLCIRCRAKRPKHLPGDVYKLGSMRGCWHGKKYDPAGNLFRHFLDHPDAPYPGIRDPQHPNFFTEMSIGLSLNLVFLDIQEHHKICECPQGSPNVSESHPYVAPTQTFTPGNAGAASSFSTVPISIPIVPQSGRCGIVPIPAPLVFRLTTNQQAGQNQEPDETQVSDALALSLPTSRVSVMDCSMSNAWFPGHLGGVKFAKLPTINTGDLRRDKIVCAVDFQEPDIRSVLNRPEDSECLALGGRKSQQEKMNAFAYETYDPEKTSVHRGLGDSISGTNMFTSTSSSNDYTNIDDPHKCQRCLQRETLIRLERRKAEHRSKKMLDRGLRSFGSGGGGYNWDMKNDGYDDYEEEEEDGDEDEEEEEEMKDVDVDELGIDMEGIIAQARSRSVEKTDDDSSSSSSQYVSYGDDYSEQNLDADLRSRRCYDKSRVGVECRGVADVLLSGETGNRCAVWPQSVMYGRVRPWDGLIGILRRAGNRADNTISNFFIFGYIVGENNFVGEWRLAATDPLNPTWGGAFVMSRKID